MRWSRERVENSRKILKLKRWMKENKLKKSGEGERWEWNSPMCSDANRVKFAEQIEKRNLINWIPGIVREMWASAFSRRCRHCCCCYPACFSLLLFASTPTITRSLSSSSRFFPPYHSPMDKLFNRRFSRFCWVTLDSVLCSPRFPQLQHQKPSKNNIFLVAAEHWC